MRHGAPNRPLASCVSMATRRASSMAQLHYERTIDDDAIFLGLDDQGRAVFAGEESQPLADARDLRSLAIEGPLPASELATLAQARSLLHWHQRHGSAPIADSQTEIAGRRLSPALPALRDRPFSAHRSCRHHRGAPSRTASCSAARHHGPRAAIRRLPASWSPARRSKRRRAGKCRRNPASKSARITYVASQPWPFPSSLMIGLIGEALNQDIIIDKTELEDARWFSRAEHQAHVRGTPSRGLERAAAHGHRPQDPRGARLFSR